jgi:branched-chain amino acid transport system permease protein
MLTNFLQQLINGIVLGSNYALIALGYTMVYGVLRLINFAHGDIYMLGAFMGYYVARFFQELVRRAAEAAAPSAAGYFAIHFLQGKSVGELSITGALIVMIVSMTICGFVGIIIERFAYRPVRHHSRLTSLITAIGVSLLLEYGGQVVFGATPRFFPQMVRSEIYSVGGLQITNQSLLIIVASVALIVRREAGRGRVAAGPDELRDATGAARVPVASRN